MVQTRAFESKSQKVGKKDDLKIQDSDGDLKIVQTRQAGLTLDFCSSRDTAMDRNTHILLWSTYKQIILSHFVNCNNCMLCWLSLLVMMMILVMMMMMLQAAMISRCNPDN